MNDLEKRLLEILRTVGIEPGKIIHVDMRHEDGCRSIKTQCLADCTCHMPKVEKIPMQ